MTRRAFGLTAGLLALVAVAAMTIGGRDDAAGPRPADQRPALALVTSLPLMFGESFGLDQGGSAALTRLEQRYRVMPIGVADAASLGKMKLLLMAHPRAQPAEVLVELDQWVRDGGRLLLLADPRLDWPSERALGDRLRPPPAFADTGLLRHWGVSLGGPAKIGPQEIGSSGRSTSSPGVLASEACQLAERGLIARCQLGQGFATIVADADFLDVETPEDRNLDLLIDELAGLESR